MKLVTVAASDLPELQDWLKCYLPDSWKMYGTISGMLQGWWQGTTFRALVNTEWPDILAVGEGVADEKTCASAVHFSEPRITAVFSSSPVHLETLLRWPGFLDWSKPIVFQATAEENCNVIHKVSVESAECQMIRASLLWAEPGAFSARPVPEELTMRKLDPKVDTDFVYSNWDYNHFTHAKLYVEDLITQFPSVGLYDRNGCCVGAEVGNEWGGIGLLYVSEEFRGRGLGKIITSQLAQSYFSENRPVVVGVVETNKVSIEMHLRMGFKTLCKHTAWVIHGNPVPNH